MDQATATPTESGQSAPTTENTAPPPEAQQVEKPKADDNLHVTKRLEVLTRRESRLAQERAQAKAEKEALEAEKAEVAAIKALRERKDIRGLMKELGVSFDDLVKEHLEAEKSGVPPEIKEKLTSFEQKMAEVERKAEEKVQNLEKKQQEKEAKAAQEAALKTVDAWLTNFNDTVKQKAESHEFSSVLPYENDVMEILERFAGETGELASPEEILTALEQQYEEEVKGHLQKLWGTKKFQAMLSELNAPPKDSVKENTTTDVREKTKPSPTLRNSSVGSSVMAHHVKAKTDAERINRAASLIKHLA